MRQQSDVDQHQHFISGKHFKILIATILLSILGYFLFTLWAGWENVVGAIRQVGLKGICIALGELRISFSTLAIFSWCFRPPDSMEAKFKKLYGRICFDNDTR